MNTYELELETGSPTHQEIYKGYTIRVYKYFYGVVEKNGEVRWVSDYCFKLEDVLASAINWIELVALGGKDGNRES